MAASIAILSCASKNDFGSSTSAEPLNEVSRSDARRHCGNLEMSFDLTHTLQKPPRQTEFVSEPCCRCRFQYGRKTCLPRQGSVMEGIKSFIDINPSNKFSPLAFCVKPGAESKEVKV